MLEYTVLFFIIPALYALSKNIFEYFNGFIFLIITSYIYHSKPIDYKINNNQINKINFFWIDQFAMWNIVIMGTYNYFQYCDNIISKIVVPVCCLGCACLYLYNKYTLQNNLIHSYIHALAIIGHSLIIFGITPSINPILIV
jgi:hypothetical protein